MSCNKDEKCCCCGHDHKHEHEHKHKHEHKHDHDHDGCGCGCGCGHDHHGGGVDKPLWKVVLTYLLGAIPVLLGFIPVIPLPLRIAFSVVGYVLFGYSVWRDMIRGFTKGKVFTEFTLMCLASVGAFAIGEFADAAAVVYLYSLGEMLSDRAYRRSERNIAALLEITPDHAVVVRNGENLRVEPEDVEVGETILLVTGERLAIDGIVISGGGEADTSSVTGEAVPLALYEGVFCPSGSILTCGTVMLRTVATYENSVISRLSEAVEEASEKKSASEKKISRFAKIFTPLAFGVAFAVAAVGSVITKDVATWVKAGLIILVVSCPCSLVLSVPLTYFAGLGRAARRGIMISGGEVMDALVAVRGVTFDKTGTLTSSSLSYDGAEIFCKDGEDMLCLAYDVLSFSPHAAARSFCDAFDGSKGKYKVTDAENLSGRGVICTVDGKKVLFGNAALMREHGIDVEDSKTTAIFGAVDGVLWGRLDFSSRLKPNAADAIGKLKKMGVRRIALISGDGETSVSAVAKEVGIDEYYSSVTPAEKSAIYERITAEEREKNKNTKVAYCGDGLNDSAVIALADVGVAMGSCGAALTVESADVILVDDDPRKLVEAIKISKRTSRIATQNIILSLGIKIAVVLLGVIISSAGGNIPMELAIAADVGAAVIAVLNAVRASGKGGKNGR